MDCRVNTPIPECGQAGASWGHAGATLGLQWGHTGGHDGGHTGDTLGAAPLPLSLRLRAPCAVGDTLYLEGLTGIRGVLKKRKGRKRGRKEGRKERMEGRRGSEEERKTRA